MRKLISLLEIVLSVFEGNEPKELTDYINREGYRQPYKWNGLCQVNNHLYYAGVTTKAEYILLTEYFEKCEPKNLFPRTTYWWEPKIYKPRITWLKAQIKSLNF